MSARARSRAAAVAAALAAALAAGCGLGAGAASSGEAELLVTRDYGAETLVQASVSDPPASETVIRLLDREAEITTRYGGGFVQSIEGIEGGVADGRSFDWFFYVNGVESEVGAAEVEVRAGDRIWWDHRDWTDAMRVPAVAGSWPEPFVRGAEGETVEVECVAARPPCQAARRALESAGAVARVVDEDAASEDAPRMLVGTWTRIASHPAARLLASGPAASGVFARFAVAGGRVTLTALDARARAARELGPGAGLVAATRTGADPPTWIVAGTDATGVAAAARLLAAKSLGGRYAVAVAPGVPAMALPAEEAR